MSENLQRLINAAEAAGKIRRPEAKGFGIGTPVIVYGPRVRRGARVTAVGRTWISVSDVTFRFHKDTLRANAGNRTAWHIKTLEQDRYDRVMESARERLRRAGIALSGVNPPPDGHIVAYAALSRLLAENGEN